MDEVFINGEPEEVRRLTSAAEGMTRALIGFARVGAGPITGAREYAEARIRQMDGVEPAIRRIVLETTSASASNGFVTGLGGLVAMPITIPMNFLGGAMLNVRMVGAIAAARGWDLDDPAVQQLLLQVVAGETAAASVRAIGVTMGAEFTKQAIKRIPRETILAVNRKVGFMLLAKYGTKRSAITLAKAVPLVGGVVGGTVDAGFTRAAAGVAKKVFPLIAT